MERARERECGERREAAPPRDLSRSYAQVLQLPPRIPPHHYPTHLPLRSPFHPTLPSKNPPQNVTSNPTAINTPPLSNPKPYFQPKPTNIFPPKPYFWRRPARRSTQQKMEMRCFKCGDGDHLAADCRKLGFHCFNCKKFGHKARDCPLHSRPESLEVTLPNNNAITQALSTLYASAFLHLINPRRIPPTKELEHAFNFAWGRRSYWWTLKRVSDGVYHVQFQTATEAEAAIAEGVFNFSGFNATFSPWSAEFGARLRPKPSYIWVNLQLLPFHLWNRESVEHLVKGFGKLITLSREMLNAESRDQALVLLEVEDLSLVPKTLTVKYATPWDQKTNIHDVPVLLLGNPIPVEDVQTGRVQLFNTKATAEPGSTSFWRPVNHTVNRGEDTAERRERHMAMAVEKFSNPRNLGEGQQLGAQSSHAAPNMVFFQNAPNQIDFAPSMEIAPIPPQVPKSTADPAVQQIPIITAPISNPTGNLLEGGPQADRAILHITGDGESSADNSKNDFREMIWEGKSINLPLSLFDKIQPVVEAALQDTEQREAENADKEASGNSDDGNSKTATFRTRSLLKRTASRTAYSSAAVPPGFQEGPSKKGKQVRPISKLRSTRPFMKHLSSSIKKKASGTSSSTASVSNTHLNPFALLSNDDIVEVAASIGVEARGPHSVSKLRECQKAVVDLPDQQQDSA